MPENAVRQDVPRGDDVTYGSVADLALSDRFTKVATCDLDEARSVIEKMQGPFIAHTGAACASYNDPVHVRAASCGGIGMSTFKFGRTVDIVPEGLAGSILVTTTISGKAGLGIKTGAYGIHAGTTFISQQDDVPIFSYETDTEVLKLRFNRTRLEECCCKMYDQAPTGQLRFDALMSRPDAANRWTSLLRFVIATLNSTGESGPSRPELASMEEILMLTLLSIQPSNYRLDSARATKVSPRQFKQAADYIEQHLDTDMRLSDIADAACCSIRSLTRSFQLACDTTPMQYVHRLRLQRVRAGLSTSHFDDHSIAEIAYLFGFRHLGEFNRKYRVAFGETPSATRASRGSGSESARHSSPCT
jgi:AraC-like DNA-binding protein